MLSGIVLDEVAVVAVHHEADVLGIVLPGIEEAVMLRQRPHLVLAFEIAEGEGGMGQLLLTQEVEHIALVLLQVPGLLQKPAAGLRVLLNPGIVTRDDEVAVQRLGPVIELFVLHEAVAVDAGIGRAACLVGLHKAADHLLLEVVGEVEDIVGHVHGSGHLPGILRVRQRTAGIGAADADILIVIELHGDADAVIAGLLHERSRHRAVYAAAHCDQSFLLHALCYLLCARLCIQGFTGLQVYHGRNRESRTGGFAPYTLLVIRGCVW